MKKILGLIIALMMTIPAFASVAVSPTKIEINANKIKSNYVTTAIEIKGDMKQPMRFKAYPGYFTINEKGDMNIIDTSDDVYNLSKKIRFVPSEFTILPGKVQKLRINVAGLNQLPDGENRAVLYIEDVNPKEMSLDTGHAGIGAQLIVKTRIGVPIYVDKGKFTKKAEIEYFNIEQTKDGVFSKFKILSTGNSKIRYNAKIQIIDGKKLLDEYSLEQHVVGQNNSYVEKDLVKVDKLVGNFGEYTIRLVISYDDENGKRINLKKDTTVKIQGRM